MLNDTMEIQSAKSRLQETVGQMTWFLQQINCNEVNMEQEPRD